MTRPNQNISILNKNRILKTTREKDEVTYKGIKIRITTDFSMKTFKPEGLERPIFNKLQKEKEKNQQAPPLPNPSVPEEARGLALRSEGQGRESCP